MFLIADQETNRLASGDRQISI